MHIKHAHSDLNLMHPSSVSLTSKNIPAVSPPNCHAHERATQTQYALKRAKQTEFKHALQVSMHTRRAHAHLLKPDNSKLCIS